ncbi:efflux RND transporter periplasmic adaptor subunit [Fulvivirga sp. M361]|uniref:efflux RND transporter periplasmic adaptor subunit n=1 Tax=Fulvivirga sp. M361 TaxID=2594266 RepID=UPI00117BCC83|nr:efflux RND transporter periplasmic adaptor subunit [Fulvivirga sp. M361]TRX60870.1 efflux RND transporter periplasmic adaptor subunit [Fulvivirga sp. M361]
MATKKKSNKWIYYLLGGFILIVLFVVVGKSTGWIGNPNQTEVILAQAARVSITEKVSASGMVQPVVEIKMSPEVSGELISLNVEEGDSVRQNEVLAKIRPDNFVAALEQSRASLNTQRANRASSEASLSRSKATFQRAKLDYERQQKLWDEKVISEADWQLAQQNYDVAKNDLKSAQELLEAAKFVVKSSEASLSQAQENLRRTTIIAPMSGIISKLNVEKGETVLGTQQFQGTEIMRIADLNKMEVRVNVNENDIIRVTVGDTVIIDVDSYSYMDKEFKGTVTAIANTANDKASSDAVTEFEVRIRILNSSYQDLVAEGNKYPFRPGMTASVEIITNQKDNVLSVPLSAVTTRIPGEEKERGKKDDKDDENKDDDKSPGKKEEVKEVVFVAENGVVKMKEVVTGISDYENIEVLDGVEQDEYVVSGPFLVVSKRLEEGDLIKEEEKKEKDKTKK